MPVNDKGRDFVAGAVGQGHVDGETDAAFCIERGFEGLGVAVELGFGDQCAFRDLEIFDLRAGGDGADGHHPIKEGASKGGTRGLLTQHEYGAGVHGLDVVFDFAALIEMTGRALGGDLVNDHAGVFGEGNNGRKLLLHSVERGHGTSSKSPLDTSAFSKGQGALVRGVSDPYIRLTLFGSEGVQLNRLFLFAASLALCAACAPSVEESAAPVAQAEMSLEALIDQRAADLSMSGVVRVVQAGDVLAEAAYQDVRTNAGVEITAETAFQVASITKSFTAVLALQEVEKGRLDLNATLADYLPAFEAAYADQVTVRQLLQNRSGIPHYVDIPGWFEPEVKDAFTQASFLEAIAALELRSEPGTTYYYSNANYYLLGLILEEVTGESYEVLLAEGILAPLGLEGTGQIYDEGSVVAPSFLDIGGDFERINLSNRALFRATASMSATAEDLTTFGEAMIAGALLSEEMQAILWDAGAPMAFQVATTALGGAEVPVVLYNGELVGTTSLLVMFPEQEGVVVLLANNSTSYGALLEWAAEIAEAAF